MKIVLEKGQNIHFTSDTHYSHKNICRGTTEWKDSNDKTRDFPTLEAMNATIVKNINERVKETDILVHLGDWSFGGFDEILKLRKEIICKNIILTYGNHDHHILKNKNDVKYLFQKTTHYLNLEVISNSGTNITFKYNFVCSHYPIVSWENMNKGVIQLFGHVHLPWEQKLREGKAMDVGMDGHNMRPYSYYEIVTLMNQQPIRSITIPQDHHENEVR